MSDETPPKFKVVTELPTIESESAVAVDLLISTLLKHKSNIRGLACGVILKEEQATTLIAGLTTPEIVFLSELLKIEGLDNALNG